MRLLDSQSIQKWIGVGIILLLIGCDSERPLYDAKVCRDHFQAESYQVALRSCVKAAKGGHLDSQWIVANIFMQGLAGDINMPEAIRWLDIAANNGHTAAQRELGKSYMSASRSIPRDIDVALKWLKVAARKGDAEAEFSIGIIFLGSKNRQPDQASALHWFKKAAAKGNSGAMNNLAWIYATSPNKSLRNGEQAIKLAKRLLLLNPKSSTLLDTLAAAFAENGEFDLAIIHQEKAWQQLPEGLSQNVLDGYRKRLDSYKQGKPWRESQPDWDDSYSDSENGPADTDVEHEDTTHNDTSNKQ